MSSSPPSSNSPSPSPSPNPPRSGMAMVPAAAATAPPRRLPPLCWTDDEAAAVTEAFRDRWFALGRVNLKAPDWQDVSNSVAARCGTVKTPLQCRHKVEKLRKRYRNERRRLESSARPRPTSWALYQTFHEMESPSPPRAGGAGSGVTIARPPPPPESASSSSSSGSDETSSDEDDGAERQRLYANGNGHPRLDARLALPPPLRPRSGSYDGKVDGFRPSSVVVKKRPRGEDVDPMLDVARAIRQLGESFVRVEQMKMDNAKQVEQMRMNTEWKRLEIMMETQQKLFLSLYGSAGIDGGVKKQKKLPSLN